eukprot:5028719-Alexandrium_andersonii.AAC.1
MCLALGAGVEDEGTPGLKDSAGAFGDGHEVRPAMSFAPSEVIPLKVAEERGKHAQRRSSLVKQETA